MVHGVISNNFVPSIGYVPQSSGGGKISLPVARAVLVYSYFEHVSGVPAPEGSRGVTINRLNILDILIERMNQMRKNGTPIAPAKVPESGPDAMIEAYQTQILQAAETQEAMPYIPVPQAQTGVVFSLTV